ncbi:citramalate synthase [Coleofasciculus sp. FACHB-64]|uniref:citramalate synthase n=1 Tax=Cyanophyceae TaxID=3028117 RepID=UPI001684BCF9|nr:MULTISPECIES: citramalate synthase [unclassified Coleofasciculus]MBD1841512.1 citramalate synthase [Coleofasciculus sp. FACHB-501]MBD2048938.1 citramalate synthase [Coleofasciculus sp. FACHB-64]
MHSDQTNRIWIYDTTLRDGAQREGLSLSLEDKLRIARKLDKLGVPFIEGGWPGANPKDVQFFWQLKEEPLSSAEVVAFCSTRRPNTTAAEDPMLQPILAAGTRWVTIFGKSWDLQVIEGLKTSLEENLAMIGDTIEYLRSQGRRVIYDAEHWFDGYKHNRDYALKTLESAIAAGAEWLVFCDTNGGTLPHEISQIVRDVASVIGINAQQSEASSEIKTQNLPLLGIHTHNDSDTAVANALAAVMEGARMVQGTINGYGERCGNANLCSVIPNLQLKLGYDCIQDEQLLHLTAASRSISEVVNLAPDEHAPFVGRSAFAHKGGIHVSAVERNPLTYEHIQPEQVGNERRIVISDQAGLSNILAKARSFGIDLDKQDPACRQLLRRLKELENEGYQFEAAEASFDLLMREALGQRQQMFELKGFQVHCDIVRNANALATVKVAVNGKDILEAAEANGPVSALDAALRKALVNFYPEIAVFHLTDYKVRILDSGAGTSAKTRVLVESSNGHQRWATVGVSSNILEASYQAVVEGIEYGLLLQSSASWTTEVATTQL